MTQRTLSMALACAQLMWVAAAGAQTVTGRILERSSEVPLPGVVVQLLDSQNNAAAQTLTNERGEYRLATSAPGMYRVRTLRIGFRPATSEPVRLEVDQVVPMSALVTGLAISLDTVRVVGRNACRAVGNAAATFAIWEQARTALTAVSLSGRSRILGATLLSFRRSLEPGSRRIMEQSSTLSSGFITRPWISLPVDSLRRVGYVVTDDNGWRTYYAPDLNVLLSDAFVEDHCFRVAGAGQGTDSRSIGITFEPNRQRRGIAGIRGTLWLDRASSELRRLEFSYTNVSVDEDYAGAGGDVDFARMSNGAWIISRWEVRMPILETRYVAASGVRSRARVPQVEVASIRVEGGAISLVRQGADTVWAGRTLSLNGMVQDSLSGATLPGTRLSLRGAGRDAVSDASGRFRFHDVLPGEYTIDVRTPQLDALGALHSVPVTFMDASTEVAIRVPSATGIARAQCGARDGGVVAGRVYVAGDAAPRPNVIVTAEWTLHPPAGAADMTGAQSTTRWLEVRSDARGNYRICGAPVNTEVTVRARTDSGTSAPTGVRLADNVPVVAADLTVDRPLSRTAVLSGVVLSDFNGAPILDAEVALPALSRTTFTDAGGAFRIAEIPPGTHRVQVRRIGWQPRAVDIEFKAGQSVERRLLISRVQLLDTVSVVQSYAPRDFEENRKQGLGRFLTREDLEKVRGRKLSDALRDLPGLGVAKSVSGTRSWIMGGRGTSLGSRCVELEGMSDIDAKQKRNCGCFAQVYLDGMRLYSGEPTGIVPDIDFIPPESIEAIEFYAGAAQTPLKYSTLNSNCGVLVIHTRRYRRDDRN